MPRQPTNPTNLLKTAPFDGETTPETPADNTFAATSTVVADAVGRDQAIGS
ncbi:MAG: hypothetical protein ACKOEX_10660 [Planctomycetia bacterium]